MIINVVLISVSIELFADDLIKAGKCTLLQCSAEQSSGLFSIPTIFCYYLIFNRHSDRACLYIDCDYVVRFHQGGYVFTLFVCLFVCLLNYAKTTKLVEGCHMAAEKDSGSRRDNHKCIRSSMYHVSQKTGHLNCP